MFSGLAGALKEKVGSLRKAVTFVKHADGSMTQEEGYVTPTLRSRCSAFVATSPSAVL